MKKIARLISAVVISALASLCFADQSLISHSLRCDSTLDYCVVVNAGSPAIHDMIIKADAKAYGHHEEKTLDWKFWEDGRYGAGINNSTKNLDYLQLTVLTANGMSVSGNCEIHAYKGQTGNYSIILRKNNDGSIACVQNG
jgi:hypothetical protein